MGEAKGRIPAGFRRREKEILPRQRTKKQQQHRKASEHARQTPTQVQQPIRFSLLPCCPSMLVRYKTELNKTRAHSSSEWLAPEHESRIGNEILVCEIYRLIFFFHFLRHCNVIKCYKFISKMFAVWFDLQLNALDVCPKPFCNVSEECPVVGAYLIPLIIILVHDCFLSWRRNYELYH